MFPMSKEFAKALMMTVMAGTEIQHCTGWSEGQKDLVSEPMARISSWDGQGAAGA